MSLCDRCYDPGACCREIFLRFPDVETGELLPLWFEPETGFDEALAHQQERGQPFIPKDTWETDINGYPVRVWTYTCPKLDKATGRCTIYESRPDLCAAYEPRSDGLCVHFNGAESGDPTVPLEE